MIQGHSDFFPNNLSVQVKYMCVYMHLFTYMYVHTSKGCEDPHYKPTRKQDAALFAGSLFKEPLGKNPSAKPRTLARGRFRV